MICNQWNSELDKRLERITQEKIANLSLYEVRQQRTALEQFGNDLAFQLAAAFDANVSAK